MKHLDEKGVIRIISSALGIDDLDDVATIALAGQQLVFKSDMLVGSTDVPSQMKPWQAARKSIVSCASDLAAKGATPVAAMISLGLPKAVTESYVRGLAGGFRAASKEFGVKIVGGDTNETGGLIIDCSMIGVLAGAGNKVPPRSGARRGDSVVISGRFGYPAVGFALLLKGALSAGGQFHQRAVDSVLEPQPRQKFGTALARFFTSSIDSSDGLAISLYELALQSHVNIQVDYESLMGQGVDEFAQANKMNAKELVFYGGEEYEIVATIPPSIVPKALAVAKKAGVELIVIGKVKNGSGLVHAGKALLENRGYTHFT